MNKRRGRGEGAIYKRESDGRWCTALDLGIVGGKRRQKVIYGKTRKEVVEKLKAAQREHEQGVNLAREDQTVAQFLTSWLDQMVKPELRPKTYESYLGMVEHHLIPHLGHYRLRALAPEHVQAMLSAMATNGRAARTRQYARAVLRRALGQALKWNRVTRNVATLVDAPKLTKHPITPLTHAQAQALLDAVHGHRLEALYRVALSLGLRKGEVLGLRWSDIDRTARTLRIAQTVQRVQGELRIDSPKTQHSSRILPLPPLLLSLLEAHRVAQATEQRAYGADWNSHNLVFPSEVGTPIEPRNLTRQFKTVLDKAGLPATTRFHDLRHSCATLLIAQGVHPRVVMELLGHAQISTTMNIYGHVVSETQRDATERVDGLFTRPAQDKPGEASGPDDSEAHDEAEPH